MLVVTPTLKIPLKELHFTFARSSGPGGQNVNKVNTKATLKWAVVRSTAMPASVRERFVATYPRRINKEGELILTSQRFRDQGRNVADCLEKLRLLLADIAVAPKRRKKTRRTKAANAQRLADKRARSEKKQRRQSVSRDDN
ncbi:MAG: alternative ribosome rescue aminoacyl-tRNA hydrolase ArfB [Planctomycetales bacterium]